MIAAQEVTNDYLYGSLSKPSRIDNESLIRPEDSITTYDIDTAEYMDTGPGRFANPVFFEVIQAFFSPENSFASAS